MRWGALAHAIGRGVAFTGMDRLEPVRGDRAWLFTPAAWLGIELTGLGWILLGLDVAFRRRHGAAPPLHAAPGHPA